MADKQTQIVIVICCALILFFILYPVFNSYGVKREPFFGGYYYPYDYPYYWPFFYTGCNEDVFGNIKCLPMYMHPFW